MNSSKYPTNFEQTLYCSTRVNTKLNTIWSWWLSVPDFKNQRFLNIESTIDIAFKQIKAEEFPKSIWML